MTAPIEAARPIRLGDLITAITEHYPDPLSRVTGAAVTSDHLGEVADQLLGHFVDQARRSGATWAEIGGSIGVTRQAAQKRFTDASSAPAKLDPSSGFAAFSEEARSVVMAAQNDAQQRQHGRVTAAHLLMGVLAVGDGIGARILNDLGRYSDAQQAAADALPERGEEPSPDLVPYDEDATEVLSATFDHANRLGAAQVTSAHILMAIAYGDGPLRAIGLSSADVDPLLDD